MRFNVLTFVVSSAIAKSRGVPAAVATRDGLLGAVIGPPVLGIVLASSLAQNQASAASSSNSTSSSTSAAGGVIGVGISSPSSGAPEIFSMERDSGRTVTIHGRNFGFDPDAIRVGVSWIHEGTTSSHPEIPSPKRLISTHSSTAFSIDLPVDIPDRTEITLVVSVNGVASAPRKFHHPLGADARTESSAKSK